MFSLRRSKAGGTQGGAASPPEAFFAGAQDRVYPHRSPVSASTPISTPGVPHARTRPRGKTPWASEADFVRAVAGHLWSSVRGCVIIEQVSTSFGVPDVAVLRFDEEAAGRRARSLVARSARLELAAARLIAGIDRSTQPIKMEASRSFVGQTKKVFQRALQCLVDRNLLLIDGEWLLPISGGFVLTEVTIYEAKLSDWTRALEQAHRHLWLTDQSFILMPPLAAEREARISTKCRHFGVGLAVFEGGCLRIRIPCSGSYLARNAVSWLLNEAVVDNLITNAAQLQSRDALGPKALQ